MSIYFCKIRNKSGFTLVEMIVSLGIFSVVAVVALGALVKIMTANQKAQTLYSAITNLNFALESMSRELRVGTTYHCVDNYSGQYGDPASLYNFSSRICSIGNHDIGTDGKYTDLAFMSSRTAVYVDGTPCFLANIYRFKNISGVIHMQKAEQKSCGAGVGTGSQDFVDVLSSLNITLTDYRLGVINNGPQYPFVYISLTGTAGERVRSQTDFDIHTVISSRVTQI